jgi:pimeloyl-ACP methyl ester carboxylesterase
VSRVVRHPYMIGFSEQAAFKETYGGVPGRVFVEAMQVRPADRDSKTAIVFSHPIGGGSFLPIMTGLAAAGHHVVYVNTRYRGNDSALIMEKCVLDLGAAVRDLRERFGYDKIVLGGWSGGGSQALFYQEQAERPTIKHTPAGDPLDLSAEALPPADAIFLVAAHVSRAVTLTEWMDPSISDERDPGRRDRELNLFDAGNPNQPPYGAAFVERYRAAQVERNRRITRWVQAKLAALRDAGRGDEEFGFTVHGTMADPRWLDPTLDPNDRPVGTSHQGDPRIANDGPIGLARFCTLRSWLSQWSFDESNAHGERNGRNTHVPTLVVGNGADLACPRSHTKRLFDAIPHDDKEMHEIPNASHYYTGQPDEMARCIGIYSKWLQAHGLGD